MTNPQTSQPTPDLVTLKGLVAELRSALERVQPILANAEQAFRNPPSYNDPSLNGWRFEGLASGTAIGVRVVAEALARLSQFESALTDSLPVESGDVA